MFERYAENARLVIFWARHEATATRSDAIGPPHLLLGLISQDHAVLGEGVNVPALERDIHSEFAKGFEAREEIPTSADMPLTDDAKKVLVAATEEADRMGHRNITTHHILAGLLGDQHIGRLLHESGIGT